MINTKLIFKLAIRVSPVEAAIIELFKNKSLKQ